MTRKFTLFASILAAIFVAGAAGQQATVAAPTGRVAPVHPQTPIWIPPSFDVQTTPPEEPGIADAAAPGPLPTIVATVGEEVWGADDSANGTRPDASH